MEMFDKFLQYDAKNDNLWDIVALFETEKQKLNDQKEQYDLEIKSAKQKLKELREQIEELHNIKEGTIKKNQKEENNLQILLNDLKVENEMLKETKKNQDLQIQTLNIQVRDLQAELSLQEKSQSKNINSIKTDTPKIDSSVFGDLRLKDPSKEKIQEVIQKETQEIAQKSNKEPNIINPIIKKQNEPKNKKIITKDKR